MCPFNIKNYSYKQNDGLNNSWEKNLHLIFFLSAASVYCF